MRDTAPQAADRYFELLRQQSPQARLASAVRLTRAVRQLALADLKQRHPDATPQRLRALLAERLYGKEVAERVFAAR